MDRRAYNEGRPKIPEIEKLRRKAKRDHERYLKAKADLRRLGREEPKPREGPGRPKKTRQEAVRSQLVKLRMLLSQVRKAEKEYGEPHKTLKEINDPLLQNKTVTKVGRKPADELTENDYQLVQSIKAVEDICLEIQDLGIHPKPPKKGRRPKNRLDKLEDKYARLRFYIARMIELEKALSNEEKMERQIKLYFDENRTYRKLLNMEQYDRYHAMYRGMIEKNLHNISFFKEKLKEVDYQRDQLGLNVGFQEIKIDRYFDHRLAKCHKMVRKLKEKYFPE